MAVAILAIGAACQDDAASAVDTTAADATADSAGDATADSAGDATADSASDASEGVCDQARATPPAAGCDDGLTPVQVYCHDAGGDVGSEWVCDSAAAEGELCKDGDHYVVRPCVGGLVCVTELYVSRCRPDDRTVCTRGADCPSGERCYGYDPAQRQVCAPGLGEHEECTSYDGAAPPGATADAIQGSCADGLHCMNGDWSGDFAFCLRATCAVDADCGVQPFWQTACISAADAGPGRVAGCAIVVPLGEQCAHGASPHDGMACAAGSVCGPADGDGTRRCVAE
ncbi:MAG: hypothetical protein U1F43_20010 [Myxococcota bacterium]